MTPQTVTVGHTPRQWGRAREAQWRWALRLLPEPAEPADEMSDTVCDRDQVVYSSWMLVVYINFQSRESRGFQVRFRVDVGP